MAKGITELIADFKELHPCAYKRIRDTAIDEFAELLKKFYPAYDIDLCLKDNAHLCYTDSCIAFKSYIDEIAEQMRKEV